MGKRWRDVKQGKGSKTKPTTTQKEPSVNSLVFPRIKAFLIDMFMINMPILYFTTYVVLGSKEAFQQNTIAIFICTALFGVILSIFFALKGQSPGYKAYELKVIDDATGKNPSFLRAFLRYICFIIAATSLVGVLIIFFRKDGKALHDILSKTHTIKTT